LCERRPEIERYIDLSVFFGDLVELRDRVPVFGTFARGKPGITCVNPLLSVYSPKLKRKLNTVIFNPTAHTDASHEIRDVLFLI
jgi:hypothetical protein